MAPAVRLRKCGNDKDVGPPDGTGNQSSFFVLAAARQNGDTWHVI
jgi:hypothetical protein